QVPASGEAALDLFALETQVGEAAGRPVEAPDEVVGTARARRAHTGDVRVAPRFWDRVEAAEVEDEVVAVADVQFGQTRDVAQNETRRDVGRLDLGPGGIEGLGDEVDAGHTPSVLRHVEDVGTGAASEVEGFARGPCVGALDQLLELGRRNPGVPG